MSSLTNKNDVDDDDWNGQSSHKLRDRNFASSFSSLLISKVRPKNSATLFWVTPLFLSLIPHTSPALFLHHPLHLCFSVIISAAAIIFRWSHSVVVCRLKVTWLLLLFFLSLPPMFERLWLCTFRSHITTQPQKLNTSFG
jgi:hypothetical protein